MKKLKYIIASILFSIVSFAQENELGHENHSDLGPRWKLSVGISQSYIPELNTNEGITSAQFIPTNGIELEYKINHKFIVKWVNEIEFLAYSVISIDSGLETIRENAYLSSLLLGYEVYEHFGIFAGVGYEFEKHEDLLVFRFGVDYLFEVQNDWSISPALIYDYKSESHQAFTFSLCIGKSF